MLASDLNDGSPYHNVNLYELCNLNSEFLTFMADFERFFKQASKKQNSQSAPKPSPHADSPELASIERLLRKEKEKRQHSSLSSGDTRSDEHTLPSSSLHSTPDNAKLASIKHLMRKGREQQLSSQNLDIPQVPEDYDLNVISTVMLLPLNPQTPDSALDSLALLLAKQAVRSL